MNDWKVITICLGLIISTYGAILVLQRWVSGHIADRRKHPCVDEVVYKDVCEQVQTQNISERTHLEDCIEGESKRTGERFKELKQDMQRGFDEVKALILEVKSDG